MSQRDIRKQIESVQQQILQAELLLRAARRVGDALAASQDSKAIAEWGKVSAQISALLDGR
jgi:hypothetical protein